MCVLTALVGINYMIICRLYPDGGGVYASVRHRSEIISIVGAFLLIADYLVTAAISALSAFQYLGVPHPEKFAALAMLIIGLLNLLGPKQTGGLAFLISIPTAIVVVVLGLFSLPHISEALGNLQPLHGSLSQNWAGFVGIVLALSGVAAHALNGLQIVRGDVNAPGAEGVRDYMLRYMGQVFVGGARTTIRSHLCRHRQHRVWSSSSLREQYGDCRSYRHS